MAEQKKYNNKRGRRPFVRQHSSQAQRPQGKRGLLSFLFGFTGSISKELYTGAGIAITILFALIIALHSLVASEPGFLATAFGTVEVLLLIMMFALGYKRAHALGFSGIYSIFGTTIATPLFLFYRADRDNANDAAYKYAFTKFKKIGAFLGKDALMKVATLCFVFLCTILINSPRVEEGGAGALSGYQIAMLGLLLFNIAQLYLYRFAFVRRYYINAFKVLSFITYNLVLAMFVVGVTVQVVLYQLSAGALQ